MPADLHHALTILAVDDIALSVELYRRLLDRAPAVETPVYAEFTLSRGERIGLYERTGFGKNVGAIPFRIPPGEVGPTELYFYSPDPEAMLERVVQAGARRLSVLAPRPWGDEVGYAADPSGNVIAIARAR